jgi:hypothetical protein
MRVLRLGAALSVAVLAGSAAVAQTPAGGDEATQLLQNTPPVAHAATKPADSPAASDAEDADASSEAPAKPIAPAKRLRRNAAILQALDKVTAETLRFEADVNQPVRYKDLVFTVHVCEESAPDEAEPGAYAHLEIDSQPKAPPGQTAPSARELFKGWMFSNAPGVRPFEHPVYDVWLIACKTAAPGS